MRRKINKRASDYVFQPMLVIGTLILVCYAFYAVLTFNSNVPRQNAVPLYILNSQITFDTITSYLKASAQLPLQETIDVCQVVVCTYHKDTNYVKITSSTDIEFFKESFTNNIRSAYNLNLAQANDFSLTLLQTSPFWFGGKASYDLSRLATTIKLTDTHAVFIIEQPLELMFVGKDAESTSNGAIWSRVNKDDFRSAKVLSDASARYLVYQSRPVFFSVPYASQDKLRFELLSKYDEFKTKTLQLSQTTASREEFEQELDTLLLTLFGKSAVELTDTSITVYFTQAKMALVNDAVFLPPPAENE